MEYHYFVCYFSSENSEKIFREQAISNCEVTMNKKITKYDDLLEISRQLEKERNRKDVVIINYELLEE